METKQYYHIEILFYWNQAIYSNWCCRTYNLQQFQVCSCVTFIHTWLRRQIK